jgi:hypothetical protein
LETYQGIALPFQGYRSYIFPPKFGYSGSSSPYIVKYSLTNLQSTQQSFKLLDYIVSQSCSQPNENLRGSYNRQEISIWSIDGKLCNQLNFAITSWQGFESFSFNEAYGPNSPLEQFRQKQSLDDATSFINPQVINSHHF